MSIQLGREVIVKGNVVIYETIEEVIQLNKDYYGELTEKHIELLNILEEKLAEEVTMRFYDTFDMTICGKLTRGKGTPYYQVKVIKDFVEASIEFCIKDVGDIEKHYIYLKRNRG